MALGLGVNLLRNSVEIAVPTQGVKSWKAWLNHAYVLIHFARLIPRPKFLPRMARMGADAEPEVPRHPRLSSPQSL